jgi:hypothetical protein
MGGFKDMDIELQEKGVAPSPNFVTILVHELNHSDPEIEHDIATYFVNFNNELRWYIDPQFKVEATVADVRKHFKDKMHQQIVITYALNGNETARRILALMAGA